MYNCICAYIRHKHVCMYILSELYVYKYIISHVLPYMCIYIYISIGIFLIVGWEINALPGRHMACAESHDDADTTEELLDLLTCHRPESRPSIYKFDLYTFGFKTMRLASNSSPGPFM